MKGRAIAWLLAAVLLDETLVRLDTTDLQLSLQATEQEEIETDRRRSAAVRWGMTAFVDIQVGD
jgi:hypothetical protein